MLRFFLAIVSYQEAEAKLTFYIRIEDQSGGLIVQAEQEVTAFKTTNFGAQTVESWLKDNGSRQTFYVNSGNSLSPTVSAAW